MGWTLVSSSLFDLPRYLVGGEVFTCHILGEGLPGCSESPLSTEYWQWGTYWHDAMLQGSGLHQCGHLLRSV